MPTIPPNGFLGFAQMVPAARAMVGGQTVPRFGSASRATSRSKPRRRKGKKRGITKSPVRAGARRSSGKRLVKGSQAARAYMAKIRKLRGKKRRG